MEQKIERVKMLALFERDMRINEKSQATIEKYLRDVKGFIRYVGEDGMITKNVVITYKQHLLRWYAVTSANSMLAAVNYFLKAVGSEDCVVKTFKVQKAAFREKERELTKAEYLRLIAAARRKGKQRLCLVMQTIGATGIRISELPFITVESLYTHQAKVCLKGKTRTVILPLKLCRELKKYAREKGIHSGSIFVTRTGRPLDRSNILHEMKSLCDMAQVVSSKISPHNLRHLFAVTYYNRERDICHLADLLGHSNINTTRVYTLVSYEEQEQQINRLGLL